MNINRIINIALVFLSIVAYLTGLVLGKAACMQSYEIKNLKREAANAEIYAKHVEDLKSILTNKDKKYAELKKTIPLNSIKCPINNDIVQTINSATKI